MKPSKPYFHITTGDTDGVGLEVTLKALLQLHQDSNFDIHAYKFLIWVHEDQVPIIKKQIQAFSNNCVFIKYQDSFKKVSSLLETFIFLISDKSAAHWFSSAVDLCLNKDTQGIITAPMSKQEIQNLGFGDLGHTDILKRKCQSVFHMAFVGKYFNTILYTDHIPVTKVAIDKLSFLNFLNLSIDFHKKIHGDAEPILLGLNPHAGDQGLIGLEDDKIKEWLLEAQLQRAIAGPIPSDSAFINFKDFKNLTFLSLYHDQGLIAFKMAHGLSGFQTTLGLSFIRTSVDHGTAKDLFNKDIADPTSMKEAILGAIRLWKGKIK